MADSEIYYDKNGFPIWQGDLVRTKHFIDYGRGCRQNYLYHVAVVKDGKLWLISHCYLDPAIPYTGGNFPLAFGNSAHREVISGIGPLPGQMFYQRPKKESN
jgi:hypothetical protein